jgi:hypothetical protein
MSRPIKGRPGVSERGYLDTLWDMSTELGVGVSADSPATGRGGGPSSRNDLTWSDLLAWLKFVLSLGLGIALGAENLNAPEASGWLRVPALLAALILCAQGPVDLSEHNRQREAQIEAERAAEQAAELAAEQARRKQQPGREGTRDEGVVDVLAPRLRSPYPVNGPTTIESTATAAAAEELDQQAKKQEAEARVTAGSVANSRGALMTVLILAIWLGLATLNYPSAPPLLLWLSLVASFLLFMSVWGGLQKRPT